MFKWILILVGVLFLYQVGGWVMGAKKPPWKTPDVPARQAEKVQEIKKEVATDVRADLGKVPTPPRELIIGGWYSVPGRGVSVQFPDGYGFLQEGDFYQDWRIKKLLGKGCLLVDEAGREFIVRFRFNYPGNNDEALVKEIPQPPPPVAGLFPGQ